MEWLALSMNIVSLSKGWVSLILSKWNSTIEKLWSSRQMWAIIYKEGHMLIFWVNYWPLGKKLAMSYTLFSILGRNLMLCSPNISEKTGIVISQASLTYRKATIVIICSTLIFFTFQLRMYNIVIRHSYTLWSAHPDKSSTYIT